MITLEDDNLVFQFSDVHPHATCSIDLQRTLRIPDDGKRHHLPPGLGSFPLRHLDDFAPRGQENWRERGGVIMPMHQAEAMWLNFTAHRGEMGVEYPFVVKVATGKINAISGEEWCGHLNRDPQDYAVIPNQPWLDFERVLKRLIQRARRLVGKRVLIAEGQLITGYHAMPGKMRRLLNRIEEGNLK